MKPVLLLFIFMGLAPLAFAQHYEWKLKKESKDTRVYFRKSADSRINEIKIETEITGSLHAVVEALRDSPMQKEWLYKCIESKRLEKVSDWESYNYVRFDFPWPLDDRDYIAHSMLRQDPKTGVVHIQLLAVPHFIPEKKDVVRMRIMEVNWKLTPLSNDSVKVENHVKSDPGGSLPTWLINMTLDQGPLNSMNNLKEFIKKDKYQHAKLSFLKE